MSEDEIIRRVVQVYNDDLFRIDKAKFLRIILLLTFVAFCAGGLVVMFVQGFVK